AGAMVAGSAPYGLAPSQVVAGPVPPDFHWGLVLLLSLVTCFLFCWGWVIVGAAWIRKINPQSRALMLAIVGLAIKIGGSIFNVSWTMAHHMGNPFAPLSGFATLALVIVTSFMMRTELEQYYNTTENINLRLEGVGSALLTLFFPVLYLQWHFSRIAKWKK